MSPISSGFTTVAVPPMVASGAVCQADARWRLTRLVVYLFTVKLSASVASAPCLFIIAASQEQYASARV